MKESMLYKSESFGPEGIYAKVIAHSKSPWGCEIASLEVKFPRFILAEMNTHRVMSRSYRSSRAVPSNKLLDEVINNPALPVFWGANQSGMSANGEIRDKDVVAAIWKNTGRSVAATVETLTRVYGLHKQTANRLIEPWMFAKGVITATDWENFFRLRLAPDAQPEMQAAAQCMLEALVNSNPDRIGFGKWHLPYVNEPSRKAKLISAARCARASYDKHGQPTSDKEDLKLAFRLRDTFHMSPFEHPATPTWIPGRRVRNFHGWRQLRASMD
jgi:thymidylate synthase ThyX